MKKIKTVTKERNYFGWIILIAMLSFLGYHGVLRVIEHFKIINGFSVTKGVVESSKKVGSKGAKYCGYSFTYKNQIYSGFDYNDTLAVGDTILIEFDTLDPNTNKFHW